MSDVTDLGTFATEETLRAYGVPAPGAAYVAEITSLGGRSYAWHPGIQYRPGDSILPNGANPLVDGCWLPGGKAAAVQALSDFNNRNTLDVHGRRVINQAAGQNTSDGATIGDTQAPADVLIALAAAPSSISVNSQKITNLADPSANSDADTKGARATAVAAALVTAESYADTGDAASVAHTVSAGTGLSGGGAISTNPTLSVTTPLTEANLRATAAGLTAALAVNGKKVTNVGAPTAGSTDAATAAYAEQYAQSLAWGIASKVPARFATTAALVDAYDYLNEVAGVGATLTKHTAGAFPAIDGITPQLLDRVLIKDEAGGNAPYNGVYYVSALGSGLLPWVLTRTLDTDTSADLAGAAVDVQVGTANGGKRFVFLADGDTFVIGVNNVTFTQTSPGFGSATPAQVATTGAPGTSGVASRDDHAHPATGLLRCIEFAVAHAATVDSATLLATSQHVYKCRFKVTTPYSANATLDVGQAGHTTDFVNHAAAGADPALSDLSLLATGDIIDIDGITAVAVAGAVRASIGGAPAAGAGTLMVWFAEPLT